MTHIRSKSLSVLSASVSALCFAGSMATAQVFTTDVIVQGSLCVGFDCVSNESFGFDTLRLKENNLRVHFDDTSASASFPSNDWRLVVNDNGNGGASYFAIEDSTGGRTPFFVEAGAPTNAMRVDNAGHLGLGTSNPVVDVHVVNGNTPTLRLEQDGSSGFTPQTWDLAGNETNFFLRDVTNSSRLVFRVQPAAPENSIYIGNSGNIGMGTTSPDADLDIDAGSDDALLALTQTSAQWIIKNNAGTNRMTWGVTGGTVPIKIAADAVQNLLRVGTQATDQIDVNGNMVLTGSITTSGSCSGGCDRVFEETYDMISIDEHAASMFANKYLPNVGATPENGPFNLSTKVGGILNELEHAHVYIDQLNTQLGEKEERLATLEAEVTAIKARFE